MSNDKLLLGGDTETLALGRELWPLAFAVTVGTSGAQSVVRGKIEKLAQRDTDVLVIGERGTGKEALGQLLHAKSKRKDGPFLVVDCAAIAPPRLERELADLVPTNDAGATLFLHGISAYPPVGQSFVLAMLRSRIGRPTNGEERRGTPLPRTRIIFGASREFLEIAQHSDLVPSEREHLEAMLVELSPLRERPEDVPHLVSYLVESLAPTHGRNGLRFSASALDALAHCPWPGNLREFCDSVAHTIEGAQTAIIEPEHIFARASAHEPGGPLFEKGYAELRRQTLARFEAEFVASVMKAARGNVSLAARLGKIDRKHLWRLMQRAHVSVQVKGDEPRVARD